MNIQKHENHTIAAKGYSSMAKAKKAATSILYCDKKGRPISLKYMIVPSLTSTGVYLIFLLSEKQYQKFGISWECDGFLLIPPEWD